MHEISSIYEHGLIKETDQDLVDALSIDKGIELIDILATTYGWKKLINYLSLKSVGNVEILESWLFKKKLPRKSEWEEVLKIIDQIRFDPSTAKYLRSVDEEKLAARALNVSKPLDIQKLEQKLIKNNVILPPEF